MTEKMKALVCYSNKKVVFEAIDKPKIRNNNDIIIRVKGAGICGSDHMLFESTNDVPYIKYPVVPGHEFAGIVEEAAKGVTDYKVGDHVVVDNYLRCGKCWFCKTGNYFQCEKHFEFGFTINGGFAEFCCVPETNLVRIPKTMSFKYAAIIENIATAINACKKPKLQFGNTVVVIGVGPLGTLIAIISKIMGSKVFIVTRNKARLERLRNLGFYKVIDSEKVNWVTMILKETSDEGVDVVYETSGSNETILGATRIVRKKGTIVLLGITGKRTGEIDLDRIVLGEINIIGSVSGQGAFEEAIQFIDKIKNDLDKIISHTFTLSNILTAIEYEKMRIEGALKVVIL